MLQNKSFVKKTRKGAVVKVVREHYLRDDLPTGSALDPSCPADQARLGAGDDTQQYLVIDTNVALHQLDFLEHAAIEDVVVCSTVLEEARARDRTSYDRLRALTSGGSASSSFSAPCPSPAAAAAPGGSISRPPPPLPPRRFFAFANEHHRETYVGPARPGESPNDRNDRAVRRVAGFYAARFPGVAVVLLTDDAGCRAAARADAELRGLGVRALSCREYARERGRDAPELADLVASAAAERRAGEEEEGEGEGGAGDGREKRAGGGGGASGSASAAAASAAAAASPRGKRPRIYSEHRPLSEVAAGLKAGTLWQGTLRVSRFNKKEAWVTLSSRGGGGGGSGSGGGGTGDGGGRNGGGFSEILVKGELAMNRAFDGDVVAVRLLPREQWSRPDERIPSGGGGGGGGRAARQPPSGKARGDDHDDDDDEEDDVLDDGARIALADPEADAADPEEAAIVAAAAAAAATAAAGTAGTAAGTQGGAEERKETATTATGSVVAVLRRSWRARGYPALLLPPKPGTDAAAALLRSSSTDAAAATTTSRPIQLLAAPMDRKLPLIRIATRQAAALLGRRVVVAVDSWPSDEHHPLGHYKATLGKAGDKAAETAALLLEHDVRDSEFSDAVLGCVPRLPWSVDAERDLIRAPYREDWRERAVVFSVDPPGCRDIDDALHVSRLSADDPRRKVRAARAGGKEENGGGDGGGGSGGNGGGEDDDGGGGEDASGAAAAGEPEFELGVHIADVSHFVRPSTPLDAEAAARGTSTYLVDRRLDMLPKALTEEICSLKSGVDRLAFSCVWTVDAEGRGAGPPPRFFKSAIRSVAALTYAEAQARIDDAHVAAEEEEGEEEEGEEERGMKVEAGDGDGAKGDQASALSRRLDRKVTRALKLLFSLTKRMRARRAAAGALELASPEVRFELAGDEANDPVDAGMYQIRGANRMVEEMMLAANVRAAELTLRAFPSAAMLRRHPEPPPRQFAPLLRAAASAGVELDASDSRRLAASLDAAVRAADPYFNKLLRILATRCMTPAAYYASGTFESAKERRHYGLAAPLYTHFTSPIRRYADVVVHRLLSAAVGVDPPPPGASPEALASPKPELAHELVAETINARHRGAQLAARASVELHTLLFFRAKQRREGGGGDEGGGGAAERGTTVADARVVAVRANGVVVFVPRFGIEGPALFPEGAGEENEEEKKGNEWTLSADGCGATDPVSGRSVRMFDVATVRISVKGGEAFSPPSAAAASSAAAAAASSPSSSSGGGGRERLVLELVDRSLLAAEDVATA